MRKRTTLRGTTVIAFREKTRKPAPVQVPKDFPVTKLRPSWKKPSPPKRSRWI